MTVKANKLINEKSPYLKQHAYNPVDWYPWSEQAFELARKENKPVLLSLGYAACHWCHVMAHESFEDKETAELMNRLFVNIKVDREERPDLDKIYQTTHAILTQQNGGWPLTVFLSPNDKIPFFSGTYFPVTAKYNLPSFKEILQYISNVYHQQYDEIQKQNADLERVLNPSEPEIADLRLSDQPIQFALQSLQQQFDRINGGFGSAPKFPQPTRLDFLLHHQSPMATDTLLHMAGGGIYDQLGGGFFRYTVDAAWRIPHFEKMLYDNAQLLYLYTLAYKKTQNRNFANIAEQTADWVMSTMQSPEGGYYSSMDADSEGHEGKYYIWDKTEIEMLLNEQEYSLIETCYGLNQPPNFENHWHFYLAVLPSNQTLFDTARQKLLTARETRTPPSLDNKILTSWNALMIKGMLTAGHVLEKPELTQSAERALAFIQKEHWKNNRLLSNENMTAYLDDYAFLIDALLTSLQIEFKQERLDFITALTDSMLTHFYDNKKGGFYFTADDHEKLLFRPKTFMDEAIPSSNAVAARCLLTLSRLTDNKHYLNTAEKNLQASWPLLTQYPAEHAEMLIALQDYLDF